MRSGSFREPRGSRELQKVTREHPTAIRSHTDQQRALRESHIVSESYSGFDTVTEGHRAPHEPAECSSKRQRSPESTTKPQSSVEPPKGPAPESGMCQTGSEEPEIGTEKEQSLQKYMNLIGFMGSESLQNCKSAEHFPD